MEESNNNLLQHHNPSSNPQTNGLASMSYIVARPPDQHDDGEYDDKDDVEHQNTMQDFDLNVEPPDQEDEIQDDQLGCWEYSMVLDFDLNLPAPESEVQVQQENMVSGSGLELPLEEETENEQENMVTENVQQPSQEDEDQRENYQPRNQLQETNLPMYIIYYNRFGQVGAGRDDLDGEGVNASGNHGSFDWASADDLISALAVLRQFFQDENQNTALGQFLQGINQSSNLSEETISEHLKTKKYQTAANQDCKKEHEICIVCQCEYENQETIGTLECGHEYHADCIKKWLFKKNLCPLCKRTGLIVQEKD